MTTSSTNNTSGIGANLIPPQSSTNSTSSTGSSGTPDTVTNPSMNLTPANFVQFLITEMQNQDPLNPTSSDAMLSQMSEIGQLQSSTDLDTDLKGLVLQNQVGSASSLIGKQVNGTDANNNPVSGVVSSVQVTSSTVGLTLDSGSSLNLGSVTSITDANGQTTNNPAS